jgi:hypothetical protein
MNAGSAARVLVLGVSLLACRKIYATDEATEAAVRFYQGYSALRQSGGLTGIPDDAQLTQLAPLITPELAGLFSAARRGASSGAARSNFPATSRLGSRGIFFLPTSRDSPHSAPRAASPHSRGARW